LACPSSASYGDVIIVYAFVFVAAFVATFLLGIGFSIGCDGICFDRLNYVAVVAVLVGLASVLGVRLAVGKRRQE
jgi:hypothetical protein